MQTRPGHIKLIDVGVYPNLLPALGCIVGCQIEEQLAGVYLYHVKAESLATLGCNVGEDSKDFPFYNSEVEVMSEG